MKKQIIFPLLWVIFCSSLSAIDFQPIKTNYLLTFDTTKELFVMGSGKLWVDSTKTNADGSESIYPSKDILAFTSFSCFNPNGSVLGKEIRMSGDSILFINYLDEKIVIKPSFTPDVYWQAFIRGSSIIVLAKIDGSLSTIDSKTIKFQVYDGAMNPISSNLNNCSIVLTRTGGITKIINLYAFPFDEFPALAEELTFYIDPSFSLSYQKSINLTWAKVNDIQPGDEIHILEQQAYINPIIESFKRKIIKKYLTRIESGDTTIYTIDRITEKVTWGGSLISYKHDTITEKIQPPPNFDQLLESAVVTKYDVGYLMTGDENQKTIPNGCFSVSGDMSSSCWQMPTCDGCFPNYTYYKGLGGPYLYCDDGYNGGEFESNYVYYKKGSTTWGTPLVLTAIDETKSDHACSVSPNPSKTSIQVKTNQTSPAEFTLLDMKGQVVLTKELKAPEETINIENLPQGVYVYRISFSDKQTETGKLVKE